jgi:predicted  nucleic acid-binding Zn-ribbon protein
MREGEVERQLKLLQGEIAVNGEELEALGRDQRAAMDDLRLEVEALRQCLERLHADFEECFATVKAEITQKIDPEAL